jgi:hypothetical protein
MYCCATKGMLCVVIISLMNSSRNISKFSSLNSSDVSNSTDELDGVFWLDELPPSSEVAAGGSRLESRVLVVRTRSMSCRATDTLSISALMASHLAIEACKCAVSLSPWPVGCRRCGGMGHWLEVISSSLTLDPLVPARRSVTLPHDVTRSVLTFA